MHESVDTTLNKAHLKSVEQPSPLGGSIGAKQLGNHAIIEKFSQEYAASLAGSNVGSRGLRGSRDRPLQDDVPGRSISLNQRGNMIVEKQRLQQLELERRENALRMRLAQ